MKTKISITVLAFLLFGIAVRAEVKLRHQGTACQLLVQGKPMLILGGELSNSAASSIADIDSVLPGMRKLGLNTVFVPVYWDLLESQEGQFDFSLVDEDISVARANDLKIVFLWFGAWKNSMSCYAPLWFKQNVKKYPRAETAAGKPLEIASAFSDEVLQADKRAFCQLMTHIKQTDSKENTVVMIQVENEIGMLESARDHSALAEKMWKAGVPPITGTDLYAEEKFQAYHYARYVEQLASAGKAIYDIPMYVNAAMNSRGRRPGEYPSAGPLAHLIPIWKSAAPSIDIYAPDIYDTDFKGWVEKYKLPDNPFFTPETKLGDYSGVRALYAFGEVDAVGYSSFAIDQASAQTASHVAQSYDLLRQLSPLLIRNQGAPRNHRNTWGLLFDRNDKERTITDDGLVMTCRHYFTLPWDARATDGSPWPEGGGLILRLAKNEYLIAGNGIVVTFQTDAEKMQEQKVVRGEDGFIQQGQAENTATVSRFAGKRMGIGYVDEVKIGENGQLQYLRRLNGDQDHQGRHARIACGEYRILHVKLYEY